MATDSVASGLPKSGGRRKPFTVDLPLRDRTRRVRLFCTDLDGTLLGSPTPALRFAQAWDAVPARERPLLVYNTGWTVEDVTGLTAARQLPVADYVIGSIGTKLGGVGHAMEEEFLGRLWENWNRLLVDRIVSELPGVRRQPFGHLNVYKSSWYWERALSRDLEYLQQRLTEAGIKATVVYSCRQFPDIVPAQAGKGQALAWLCRRFSIDLADILVCGDTATDAAMFQLPGVRGIVVGNALPELLCESRSCDVCMAPGWMAEGVMQGLLHYGVLGQSSAQRGAAGRSVPVVPWLRL